MRLRALALAGCWLWLASAANAGELRADWPLGGSHGGPLRVEWDGRGELTLISGQPYSSRPSRARRAGPGISWLSNPSYYSYSLASSATLRQTVGRHVVAETALPAVPKLGCSLLWLGQPKLSADDRDRVAGLWCDTAQSRAIAVGQPADILPDRAALLRSLRAVVVEVPLTPAQQQVIADYAFSGGLVVQRAGVAALVAKDAPATALPGRPRLTCSPLGLGGVVTVSGPITADSTLWSRINAADLRAGSPSTTSLLPEGPEMARAMDASKPIQSRYLLAFLLAYLAAIGPLTWLVARAGRGSAARGWLAAPVVAALAVTVAAAWVNANGRRQSAAYQMTNTTLDAGSRYGAARTTLRIATSSATTYTVTPTDRRARFGSAALSTLDDCGQMRVGPWSIPPRSARVLSGTAIIDVGGTVSMDLRRVGSELRGTIRNAMPYALRGAVLCWRDRIRPLGTIAPSEQVDIANAWGPWAATPGCAQVLAAMGRGNVPTNVRELVARYPRPEPGGTVRRGESPDSPPTRATLLAWVEAPWMPVEVSPKVGSQQRAQVLQVVGTVALASSDERRYTLEACRARRIEGGPAPATIAVYASRGQLPKSVSRLGVSGRTGNLALWNHRRSAWQRLSAGGSASLPAADYLRGGRVLLRDDQVATDGGRDPDAETYAQLTAPPKDVTITAIVEDRHGQR